MQTKIYFVVESFQAFVATTVRQGRKLMWVTNFYILKVYISNYLNLFLLSHWRRWVVKNFNLLKIVSQSSQLKMCEEKKWNRHFLQNLERNLIILKMPNVLKQLFVRNKIGDVRINFAALFASLKNLQKL